MSTSAPESETTVLIRCGSHRARQKLQSLFPFKLKGWYSWDTACTGGFVRIPASQVEAALAITGCSRASRRYTYKEC
jgi:hypothetical protein